MDPDSLPWPQRSGPIPAPVPPRITPARSAPDPRPAQSGPAPGRPAQSGPEQSGPAQGGPARGGQDRPAAPPHGPSNERTDVPPGRPRIAQAPEGGWFDRTGSPSPDPAPTPAPAPPPRGRPRPAGTRTGHRRSSRRDDAGGGRASEHDAGSRGNGPARCGRHRRRSGSLPGPAAPPRPATDATGTTPTPATDFPVTDPAPGTDAYPATAGEWRPQPDASPEPAPTAEKDAAPQPTAQASATTTTDPFPVSADAPAPVAETDTPAGSGSGEISGADSSPGPEPTAAAAETTTQPAAETKPVAEAPRPVTDAQAPDRDTDSPADAHTGEVPDTESADGSTASAETAPVAGTPATDEQRQDTTAPEPDEDDSNENGDPDGDGDGDGDGDQDGDGDGDRDEAPIDPEQWLAAYRPRLDPETLRESAADPAELSRIRDSLSTKIDAARTTRAGPGCSACARWSPGSSATSTRRSPTARWRWSTPRPPASCGASRSPRPGWPTCCVGGRVRRGGPAVHAGQLPGAARPAAGHDAPVRRQVRASTRTATSRRATTSRRRWSCAATATRSWSRATEVALDALFSRVAERGWGPYPRTRDEILQTPAAGADLRRALRPLGVPERRRRAGDRRRSTPTSSRSATAWPGSRPGRLETLGADRRGRPAAHRPARRLPRRRQLLRRRWPGCPATDGAAGSPSTRPTGWSSRPASTTYGRSGAAWRSVRQRGKWGAVEKQRPAGRAVRVRRVRHRAGRRPVHGRASPTRGWPSWRWAAARA